MSFGNVAFIMVWYMFSAVSVIMSKTFLDETGGCVPHLNLAQTTVGTLIFSVGLIFDTRHAKYTCSQHVDVLVIATTYSVGHMLFNYCMRITDASMLESLRSMEPLFVAAYLLHKEGLRNCSMLKCLPFICLTVGIASSLIFADNDDIYITFSLSVIINILFSVRCLLSRKLFREQSIKCDILASYQQFAIGLVLSCVQFSFSHTHRCTRKTLRHDAILLTSAIAFAAYNYMSIVAVYRMGAQGQSFGNSMRRVVTVIASATILSRTLSVQEMCSMVLVMLGSSLYAVHVFCAQKEYVLQG